MKKLVCCAQGGVRGFLSVGVFTDICIQMTGLLVLNDHQRLFTAFQEYVRRTGSGTEVKSFKCTHTSTSQI